MAEKNLPIKFFQKRQKDESENEPRGDRNLPAWANRERAIENAGYIREVLSSISKKIKQKNQRQNFIPSIIKVKLNEDATSKTLRKEISTIFNVSNKINIIGFNEEDTLLVKADSEFDLQNMVKKLSNAYDAALATQLLSVFLQFLMLMSLYQRLILMSKIVLY